MKNTNKSAKSNKATSPLLASLFKRAGVPTAKKVAVTPEMQKEYEAGVARANKIRAMFGDVISEDYLTLDDYNDLTRFSDDELLAA